MIPETPTVSDSDNSDDDSTTDLTASLSLLTTGDTVITHTVTFKCIGSTKETQYQEALSSAAARLNRGEAVLCQVLPEPNNPIDSEPICIQFELDRKWYKVGYVIHEALSDLHTALRESKVTKVSINWIKYIIYWRTLGGTLELTLLQLVNGHLQLFNLKVQIYVENESVVHKLVQHFHNHFTINLFHSVIIRYN